MKAFVVAEHSEAAVDLCAGARTMADEVVLVAIDLEVSVPCADKVLKIAVPEGAVFDDAYATVVPAVDGDVLFAEPTKCVKALAGRIAASKGAAVVTDVMEFENGVASNMYFGGVGVKKQKARGFAAYTLSGKAFGDCAASGANETVELAWVAPERPVKVLSREAVEKSGADLAKADVVVGAGRGFAEKAQLDTARALCEKTGAGLGCSRPLTEGVDWLPRETYIGVSGLMLSPKVYVALGISGQMQHMVGVNRAGMIFAVNKDKNAPIFKQCDYGLVGDIKDVVPALTAAL